MSFDLDFINRPNPVEPSALNHGSLTGKARELDRSTNEQLIPFLLSSRLSQQRRDTPVDSARPSIGHAPANGASIAAVLNGGEASSYRPGEQTPARRDVDQTLYTLPKLPVKRGTKRHRVPPVLQGLHQPPPTSGLLPSISAEDTQVLLSTTGNNRFIVETAPEKPPSACALPDTTAVASLKTPNKAPAKRPANRWTDQETNDLLNGVAKFGIGSWKRILLCPDYTFNRRTAVDLKDRFRVCKPNAYGQPRTKKAKAEAENQPKSGAAPSTTTSASESSSQAGQGEQAVNDPSVSTTAMENVDQTFTSDTPTALWKINRRQRRRFTPEEDAALLNGYLSHGVSWMTIVKAPIFRSNHRTPTDLRDRFRTRYPEKYAEAGLAPRPRTFPRPLPRASTQTDEGEPEIIEPVPVPAEISVPPSSKPIKHYAAPRHTHGIPFPVTAEDYLPEFGVPEDDDDAHHIVLDRSIMDWANSTMAPTSSSSSNRLQPLLNNEGTTGAIRGIDPLVTLKLPRPGLF